MSITGVRSGSNAVVDVTPTTPPTTTTTPETPATNSTTTTTNSTTDAMEAPGTAAPLPPPTTTNATTSPMATRLAVMTGATAEALVERRALYATLITAHTATIGGLEGDLKAINARISQKTSEANNLLQQQLRLQSDISEKQRMAGAAGVYGGLLAVFTMGASAVVGGATAAACAAAVVSLRSDLQRSERNSSAVRAEINNLNNASAAFQKQQAQLTTRLDALKTAAAELTTANAAPTATLEQLQKAVGRDQALVGNLEAQIVLLQTLKASAQGHEAGLDKLITALKKDVEALQLQLERSNRALLVALVDVALTGFGATKALRIDGLPLSQKQLLVGGLALAAGDPASLASSLVTSLVKEGLVVATGSGVLAATLTSLLKTGAGNSTAAVQALLAGASSLTSTQTALLTSLAQETRFDVSEVAKAVVAAPDLDDAGADAVRALLG